MRMRVDYLPRRYTIGKHAPPPAPFAKSLHMVEFKVPEFVNYGQRVTLQVNQIEELTWKLNVPFTKVKRSHKCIWTTVYPAFL